MAWKTPHAASSCSSLGNHFSDEIALTHHYFPAHSVAGVVGRGTFRAKSKRVAIVVVAKTAAEECRATCWKSGAESASGQGADCGNCAQTPVCPLWERRRYGTYRAARQLWLEGFSHQPARIPQRNIPNRVPTSSRLQDGCVHRIYASPSSRMLTSMCSSLRRRRPRRQPRKK